MPPIRSLSTTKPVKTERTHEENQERAYIAASRRSDRSLEARVESARRASEIHKRRTGRSLRVTEQDVINEEMYEEEDDDLPLQYRRLTAHLNTNSTDFNRRLAAYLTNHVAMRTALDQAISSSYAQQYPNGQPWVQQPFAQMQQPWMAGQMPGQQPLQSPFVNPMTMQPQMMHNSPTYRQAPYPMPMPSAQAFRPNIQRTGSITSPQDTMAFSPTPVSQLSSPVDQRRASGSSEPAPVTQAAVLESKMPQPPQRTSSSTSLPTLSAQAEQARKSLSGSPIAAKDSGNGQTAQPISAVSQISEASWSAPQSMNMSPFATTLPPDAQMFFDPSFSQNTFQSTSMMNTGKAPQPFYSYNPNNFNKPRNSHPSYDGMNQTLAPGALDSMNDSPNWPTPPSTNTDGAPTPFTPAFGYQFDASNGNDTFQKSFGLPSPDMQRSGYVTPGEAEWTTFIDPSSWADTTA